MPIVAEGAAGKRFGTLKEMEVRAVDLELKNSEGYYDLTAYIAIKHICDEEKRKKQYLSACFVKKSKTANKRKEVKS